MSPGQHLNVRHHKANGAATCHRLVQQGKTKQLRPWASCCPKHVPAPCIPRPATLQLTAPSDLLGRGLQPLTSCRCWSR